MARFGRRLQLSLLEKHTICDLDNPKLSSVKLLLHLFFSLKILLRKSHFFFVVSLELVVDRGCLLFEFFFFGFRNTQNLFMLFVDSLGVSLGFHNLRMKIIIRTPLHRINLRSLFQLSSFGISQLLFFLFL